MINVIPKIISASTAFHALELGFRTILIDDCSRGIDEKNIEAAYEKIQSWHGLVIQSNEVKNMVKKLNKVNFV